MLGLAGQTNSARRRIQSLVQLNLELAKVEAKQKAAALGIAGGLALLAAVLAVYGIGFAFASAAAGISEALPVWLALLIVAGGIFLLAAIAGYLAMRFARKASTRLKAIEEAERTAQTFQGHG